MRRNLIFGLIPLVHVACGGSDVPGDTPGEAAGVVAVTCGENTSLVDGQCVADEMLVTNERSCGDGTEYESESGSCVAVAPERVIVCGAGTYEEDGTCLLKPDSLCAAGSTWNSETQKCDPDTVCGSGTVKVDGQCLSPEEALLEDSVQEEEEGDNELELGPVGDSFLFSGEVAEPAEGEKKTDVDSWSFTGEAGDTIRLSVLPLDELDVGFVVTSEDGSYSRSGMLSTGVGMSRILVLPFTGAYTVSVSGKLNLQSPNEFTEAGGYLGTLERLAPLTPNQPSEEEWPSNSIFDLTDNLYQIPGEPGDLVSVSFSFGKETSHAVLVDGGGEQWGNYQRTDSSGRRYTSIPLLFTEKDQFRIFAEYYNYSAGELSVFVDHHQENEIVGGALIPGAPSSESFTAGWKSGASYITFEVNAGQVVEFDVDDDDTEVFVFDSIGNEVFATQQWKENRFLAQRTGKHIFRVVRRQPDAEVTLTASSFNPIEMGTLSNSTLLQQYSGDPLQAGEIAWYSVALDSKRPIWATVTPSGGDVEAVLLDGSANILIEEVFATGQIPFSPVVEGRRVYLRVEGKNDSTSHLVSFQTRETQGTEVENNNTLADAVLNENELLSETTVVGTAVSEPGIDRDVFTFEVETPGVYRFEHGAAWWMSLSLLDADQNILASDSNYEPVREVSHSLPVGTYSVVISGNGSGLEGQDYFLTANYVGPQEPNVQSDKSKGTSS